MKYFIDTEFLEGTQTKRIFGFPYGKTKPTIDLISIGIVSEDGREYYAISKDFNLKEAWNRCDIKDRGIDGIRRTYWIRENVLKPIFNDLVKINSEWWADKIWEFTYDDFNTLINKHGKSNEQIAEEVKEFIRLCEYPMAETPIQKAFVLVGKINPTFYGYYCDYDWVVFCWLFGKMIDLPKGFPMYCRDLKQMLDEKAEHLHISYHGQILGQQGEKDRPATFQEKIDWLKHVERYPKQTNEHNALADARWNYELYKFIQSL